MIYKDKEAVMKKLLELLDWHLRLTTAASGADDYQFGYADALLQVTLDIGKLFGEANEPYKFEAYKRAYEFSSGKNYWKQYPRPLADYFSADLIRQNGGKL